MIEYNKLIRDKIPDIIKSKGEECVTHIADNEEYWIKLKEKLIEEVQEFTKEESENELADIMEVVNAIIDHMKLDKTEFEEFRFKKAEARGAFKNKIILEKS
ncbi:nucleoside triphosphate pyrophosphohydrolase [Candidatus Falkowbacteria bacterium]|nr:nucleoside triphosphate pyrophosphohydrolase [Candidatus Falkowbacteria bacterium]